MTEEQKQGAKQAAREFYKAKRISLEMAIWAMKNAGYSREETADWLGLTNQPVKQKEKNSKMSNYYFCKCPKCGWMGSSEFLYGGGQIADTGDYDDVYCPVCDNWDLEDIDPPSSEEPIEKHVVILQNALLRCEYIFRNLAGTCKDTKEKWVILGHADDCKEAMKLSEKARIKDTRRQQHIMVGPIKDFKADVVCSMGSDGRRIVNIPQRIVRHSPTGFAWGYGGSGPADFALNILSVFIGQEAAERLYQNFKWDFIASIPYKGGTIPREKILNWVKEKQRDVKC